MRITTSAVVLLVVASACAPTAEASDGPVAQLVGFRCELTTLPGLPNTVILVCSTDDGEPIGRSGSRLPPSATCGWPFQIYPRPRAFHGRTYRRPRRWPVIPCDGPTPSWPALHHGVVEGIVHLARTLGLEVVAEGIETPLQLERLKALGCELGQGFLFAKPMDVEDVEAMLASGAPWGLAGRRVG